MGKASSGDTWEMACVFKAETENAVLIYDPASDENVWIPLSAVVEMHRPQGGKGEGTIKMEMWIARKKGFC